MTQTASEWIRKAINGCPAKSISIDFKEREVIGNVFHEKGFTLIVDPETDTIVEMHPIDEVVKSLDDVYMH